MILLRVKITDNVYDFLDNTRLDYAVWLSYINVRSNNLLYMRSFACSKEWLVFMMGYDIDMKYETYKVKI